MMEYQIEIDNEGDYHERKTFKKKVTLNDRQFMKLVDVVLTFCENPEPTEEV